MSSNLPGSLCLVVSTSPFETIKLERYEPPYILTDSYNQEFDQVNKEIIEQQKELYDNPKLPALVKDYLESRNEYLPDMTHQEIIEKEKKYLDNLTEANNKSKLDKLAIQHRKQIHVVGNMIMPIELEQKQNMHNIDNQSIEKKQKKKSIFMSFLKKLCCCKPSVLD